jgi:hypothetical protein
MQKWDDAYRPGEFDHLQDVNGMTSLSSWEGIESFLNTHNAGIRRKRRRRAAYIAVPGAMALSAAIFFISGEFTQPGTVAQRYSTPTLSGGQGSTANIVAVTQSGVAMATQATANPVSMASIPSANRANGNRNLSISLESVTKTDPLLASGITSTSTKADIAIPELAAVIPAALPQSGQPVIKPVSLEIPPVDFPQHERARRFSGEIYGQSFSLREMTAMKTIPVETSNTLGYAMVHVPGRGLTFSRPEFNRAFQVGAAFSYRFSRRWSATARYAYYNVSSHQTAEEYKDQYAEKTARMNSHFAHTGLQFSALNTRWFSLYAGAGAELMFGWKNHSRILQYKRDELINDFSSSEKIKGKVLSANAALGARLRLTSSLSLFAEFNVHRNLGLIKHYNAPDYEESNFYSLRAGVQVHF